MVHQIVSRLVRRYGTRDPFEIARLRHIILITEPLGSIRGYYSCSYRHQVIHLNSDLEENQLRFTCAHELGHAILHPKANTPFLRQNTLFPISRYEWEASRFAVCLLIDDSTLEEYDGCTIPQLAQAFGVSPELIAYRLKKRPPQP